MTQFEITFLGSFVGAAAVGFFSLLVMLATSKETQRRERRQQAWQIEINRIIGLEERAGQLVELIGSYRDLESIRDGASIDLPRLESDAGRFRRHKGIMQAIRDLHNGLARLMDDKMHNEDFRKTIVEVNSLYENLLTECDKVLRRDAH